jgi:hypothetical protein
VTFSRRKVLKLGLMGTAALALPLGTLSIPLTRRGSGGEDSAERLDESLSDLGEAPDPKNSQS